MDNCIFCDCQLDDEDTYFTQDGDGPYCPDCFEEVADQAA